MDAGTGPPGRAAGPETREGKEEEGPPAPSPSAGRACLEEKESTASGTAHRGQCRGQRPGTGARPNPGAPAPAGRRSRHAPGPTIRTNPPRPSRGRRSPVSHPPALTVHPAPPPLPGSTASASGVRARPVLARVPPGAGEVTWGGVGWEGAGPHQGRGRAGAGP